MQCLCVGYNKLTLDYCVCPRTVDGATYVSPWSDQCKKITRDKLKSNTITESKLTLHNIVCCAYVTGPVLFKIIAVNGCLNLRGAYI